MEQAVILAGGLGERLRPFTDNLPKPLVQIANLPFILYVINDLRSKGLTSFIILTGYRAELIREYFEHDNSVMCIETPLEFSKSERLRNAHHALENEFLLLYSDNFIPEQPGNFELNGYDLKFVLTKKSPGNFDILNQSENLIYSPERMEELNFVELGYISVNRDSLFQALSEGISLESAFLDLVRKKRATAYVIKGPYFSISDPKRYQIAANAIEGKRVILIDRDGIINKRMPVGEYVTNVGKCEFLEENLIGLKELSSKGFSFIVVSNQAGVARGYMTENQLTIVNDYISKELSQLGINILDIFTCIHGWDEDCLCRKPKPGMLYEAARKYNLYLKKTAYIGDDKRDVEAAIAADCQPIFIGDKEELGNLKNNVACASNVSTGLQKILRIYEGIL